VLDDESANIDIPVEGRKGLRGNSCSYNPSKLIVFRSAAYRDRSFDLEAKNPFRARVIKLDNKVIHGISMALLLNRNTRNEAHLAYGSFSAQK
jgi:hypothetical protein